jgi:hypothetical protein
MPLTNGSGYGSIPLTSGSGSVRPQKMRILWIRIRIRNIDAKALLACGLPGEVARVGEYRVGEDSVGTAADLGTRLLGDVASAPTKPSLLPAGNTPLFIAIQ